MDASAQAADWKQFEDGDFLIFRKLPTGISRKIGGKRIPWYRHKTLESAEKEARRLHSAWPESTFVIWQQVARLKAPRKEIRK